MRESELFMQQASERGRARQAGRWCRLGAWAIVLLGILQIVFFLWGRFANSPYYFGTFGSASEFTSTLQYLLQVIATTLFFALLLYTAGAIAERVLGRERSTNEAHMTSGESGEKESS
jgi:polyferredoxin